MTLGSGVGSAVMGAGTIVARLPFIAVACALPRADGLPSVVLPD